MNRVDLARMQSAVSGAVRRALLPGELRDHTERTLHSSRGGGDQPNGDELVAAFRRELGALAGVVHEVSGIDAARDCVREIVREERAERVLSWEPPHLPAPGLLDDLERDGIRVMTKAVPAGREERARAIADLAQADLGLTGADAGLADTGSIVLASGAGRLRAASLLPPIHVALLSRARLWPTMAAWLAAEPSMPEHGSNVVVITGPSRTADIEMTLTRGVHGPRELHVVVY